MTVPSWIDAPWWERMLAPMRAEELDRRAWIARVERKMRLILGIDEELSYCGCGYPDCRGWGEER